MPDVGLVSLRDNETGEVRTVDAGTLVARARMDERLADLRRLGVRASPVSTQDDAFHTLQRHFRARGGGLSAPADPDLEGFLAPNSGKGDAGGGGGRAPLRNASPRVAGASSGVGGAS